MGGAARAGGKTITVAWQQATGQGVLIGEDVPLPSDKHVYALWQVEGDAPPALCGTFRPEPGVTLYPFHASAGAATASSASPSSGAGAEPGGFRVTDETDGSPRAPQGGAVYETR